MGSQKKQVYILTNFGDYLKSYSPIIVVQGQLEMLIKHGYQPTLITGSNWNPPEAGTFSNVHTERILQPFIDGTKADEAFELEVDKLYEALDKIIEDDSVVITHDLIFLPDYVKHNVACRRIAAERPGIRWLHWVHSATGPGTLIKERAMYGEKYEELLNSKFPNSILCYPNSEHIPRVAKNFAYEEYEVVEVPHPSNPVEGMQSIVQRLYDVKKLGEVDILSVYPARLDRGKAAHMHVYFMEACRAVGLSAHMVYCDFQSTGDDKVVYREDIKRLASELGVSDMITFLSEFDDSARMEVPHQVILDLFTLSNVFLLPSRSETYSLIAQEAMLKGNLCYLNYDFAPFRQIYGDNALYRQFDGAEVGFDGYDGKIDTTQSDIKAFFRERLAITTKGWLSQDRVLRAKTWVRTKRNPDYIFKNFIEPLIEETDGEIEDVTLLSDSALL